MNIERLRDALETWFPKKNDPGYAIGQVIPTYIMLHGTRKLYLPSLSLGNGFIDLYSVAIGGSLVTTSTPTYHVENFLSFYRYDGVNDKHYSSGGVANTKFITVISMIAWVRFDNASLGVDSAIISKWTSPNLKCFLLKKNTADKIEFIIGSSGFNEFSTVSAQTVVADTWYFVAATFQASTAINVFVSNPTTNKLDKDSNTSSIPAALFDSSTPIMAFMATSEAGTLHTAGDASLFHYSGETIPDYQIKNAYQVARPLLGYV